MTRIRALNKLKTNLYLLHGFEQKLDPEIYQSEERITVSSYCVTKHWDDSKKQNEIYHFLVPDV